MITGLSLQDTTLRMGNYYNATMRAMSHSLTRLASGKNYNEPRDGIADFMRVQRIQRDGRDLQTIQRELTDGLNMARLGETVGMGIVDNILEMKKQVMEYWGTTDPTAQASYRGTFNGLRGTVDSLVSANYYRGQSLMEDGVVSSVGTDPGDPTQRISLELVGANDVVTIGALEVDTGGSQETALAALDDELNKARSYLSKVSGYLHSIEAQQTVTQSMIDIGVEMEENLNGVDDVKEMNNVVTRDIRQQAALSMIAQGNMYRMGVLKLINF